MKEAWLIFLVFLIFVSVAYGQQFGGGFHDFDNFADLTFTDTDRFSGPSILGASDVTVQLALQTIDASGGTLITACQTSDDFCFTFET